MDERMEQPMDFVEMMEMVAETVVRTLGRWPAWWTIGGLFLLLLIPAIFINPRVLDALWYSTAAVVLYARRDHMWEDVKRGGWLIAPILAFFIWFPHHVAQAANKAGDPYETVGERTTGGFEWRIYDAQHNGTMPLEMFGKFSMQLAPGATARVRPSRAQAHAGGYIVQLDGNATFDVHPGTDHVTIAGKTAKTTAMLPRGKYAVQATLEKDRVVVRPLAGETGVQLQGEARLASK